MIKRFIIILNLLFAFLAAPSKANFDINARTAILQDFSRAGVLDCVNLQDFLQGRCPGLWPSTRFPAWFDTKINAYEFILIGLVLF